MEIAEEEISCAVIQRGITVNFLIIGNILWKTAHMQRPEDISFIFALRCNRKKKARI